MPEDIINGIFNSRIDESVTMWAYEDLKTKKVYKVQYNSIPILLLITYTFKVYFTEQQRDAIYLIELLDSKPNPWSADIYKTHFLISGIKVIYKQNESFKDFVKRENLKITLNFELWINWENLALLCQLYGTTVEDSDFVYNYSPELLFTNNWVRHDLKWDVKPEVLEFVLNESELNDNIVNECKFLNEIKWASKRYCVSYCKIEQMARADNVDFYNKNTFNSNFYRMTRESNANYIQLKNKTVDSNISANIPVDYLIDRRISFNPPHLKSKEEILLDFEINKGKFSYPIEFTNTVTNYKIFNYQLKEICNKHDVVVIVTNKPKSYSKVVESIDSLLLVPLSNSVSVSLNSNPTVSLYSKKSLVLREFGNEKNEYKDMSLTTALKNKRIVNVCTFYEMELLNNEIKIDLLIFISNKTVPRRWLDFAKTKNFTKLLLIGEVGIYY